MRNDLKTWDGGGVLDDDGFLNRRLPSPLVHVPWRIWLEHHDGGDMLVYSWFPPRDEAGQEETEQLPDAAYVLPEGAWEPHNGYRGKKRCVDGFTRLKDASAEDVLAFARQWGVLGICEHGLPATHNPPPTGFELTDAPRKGCSWLLSGSGHWCDPVEAWRHFAQQARELVDLAAQLHRRRLSDEPVPAEEWNELLESAMWWLVVGDVRPFIFWDFGRERPNFTLGSARMPQVTIPDEGWGTLFGLLATQLAFIATSAEGFDLCDGCHELRPVEKRPRVKGRDWYCSACREDKKAANRMRKRRQRERAATKEQKGEENG